MKKKNMKNEADILKEVKHADETAQSFLSDMKEKAHKHICYEVGDARNTKDEDRKTQLSEYHKHVLVNTLFDDIVSNKEGLLFIYFISKYIKEYLLFFPTNIFYREIKKEVFSRVYDMLETLKAKISGEHTNTRLYIKR